MLRPIKKSLFRRFDSRGSSVVEMALAFPIFVLFIVGFIEFGRYFWIESTMETGAEAAARYDMVNSSSTNGAVPCGCVEACAVANAFSYPSAAASDAIANPISANIKYAAAPNTTVSVQPSDTVTATYKFSPIINLIPALDNITITKYATVPVSLACTGAGSDTCTNTATTNPTSCLTSLPSTWPAAR